MITDGFLASWSIPVNWAIKKFPGLGFQMPGSNYGLNGDWLNGLVRLLFCMGFGNVLHM